VDGMEQLCSLFIGGLEMTMIVFHIGMLGEDQVDILGQRTDTLIPIESSWH
jgi:hypothetical protein